jgi:hypothetical protein
MTAAPTAVAFLVVVVLLLALLIGVLLAGLAWQHARRPLLEAWLDHFGDSNPDGWEPEHSDGCYPYACECGFVELVHRSRLALGRPCCGNDPHPLLRSKPPIDDATGLPLP